VAKVACSTTGAAAAHELHGAATSQAEQAEHPELITGVAAIICDCTMTGRISTWRCPSGANEVTYGVAKVVLAIGAYPTVCGTKLEVTGIIVVTGIAAVTGMAVDQVGATVVTAVGFV
jgi:hypothetical protein